MGRHKLDPLRLPADGSITRALYDAFATGEPVNVSAVVGANNTGFYLEQLRSMYGCEISPGRAVGRGKWLHPRLLGRWDGPYFVPVERLHAGAA